MKVTRFEQRAEEEAAVRIFLWVGLLTTMSCAALAALAVTQSVVF
ncbi:MAG: hypothetical protein Q8M31_16395 [Beijerinckiaceae bacterium]|nr:hypothetical protein [Beijerinckiaceae bacterium]